MEKYRISFLSSALRGWSFYASLCLHDILRHPIHDILRHPIHDILCNPMHNILRHPMHVILRHLMQVMTADCLTCAICLNKCLDTYARKIHETTVHGGLDNKFKCNQCDKNLWELECPRVPYGHTPGRERQGLVRSLWIAVFFRWKYVET